MSAKYGYVWFLPIWLHKATGDLMTNGNCTREQIDEMLNGHFSISHASYARDDSIMQTNTSVGEWKKSFNNETNKNFNKLLVNSSHYSGYAYGIILNIFIDFYKVNFKIGNFIYFLCNIF